VTPQQELALRRAIDAGDAAAELAARKAIDATAEPQRINFGEPVVDAGQFQVGGPIDAIPISDIFPGIASTAERTLSMATSAIAEPVAGLVGLGQALNPFAEDGAGAQAVEQTREALTYKPRTEQAQVDQAQFAQMMQPVADFIAEARLGDEALEAGLPPSVAAAYEAFPEVVTSMLTFAGLPSVRGAPLKSAPLRIKPKDLQQASDIMAGKRAAATQKLGESRLSPGTAAVVKNKAGSAAISTGWDELAVAKVSSLLKSEKGIYRRMLNEAKEFFDDFSPKGRPSDVVGAEIAQRLKYLHKVKADNGKKLGDIIKGSFGRQKVDIDDFVGDFLQDVSELGGRIDKNGRLVFGTESRLFQMGGSQTALSGLFEKIKISGSPTAKQVHEIKGWIDEFIDYGKSPTKTDAGVSENVERLLKGYRRKLNDVLRINKDYAEANDIFSDSTGALTDMQKAMGPSIDILEDAAIPLLGQKMRTFLSNNANRIKTEVAVGEVQAIANKWGGKFPDHDIAGQMRFINEMERLWGPFTDASFKSEIGQSVQRVAESPNLGQLGREGVRMTAKQLQNFRQSQKKQLTAMETLLR
jgi:hypothetical protein